MIHESIGPSFMDSARMSLSVCNEYLAEEIDMQNFLREESVNKIA